MKKINHLIIIMFSLLLASCNNENKKVIKAISDSESYVFDVKTDMKFKCESLENLGDFYSLDSANIYRKFIADTMKISLDSVNYWITQSDSVSVIYNKLSSYYEWYEPEHDTYLEKSEFYLKVSKYLRHYNKNYANVNESNSTLLYKKYKCTYSIFNPILQTRQEITDIFLISDDYKVLNE